MVTYLWWILIALSFLIVLCYPPPAPSWPLPSSWMARRNRDVGKSPILGQPPARAGHIIGWNKMDKRRWKVHFLIYPYAKNINLDANWTKFLSLKLVSSMIWGSLCVWINNHFWAMSDGSEMKNNQPISVLWLTALEAQEINFVDKLSLVLAFVEIWDISQPLVQKYFWCENVFCKVCDVCSGIVWSLSQQNVQSWQRRYLRAWKRPHNQDE